MSLQALYTVGQSSVHLSSARPVQWQHFEMREAIAPHDHEFTEVVIVQSGTISHRTGESQEQISSGEVLVIPPGPVHAYGAQQVGQKGQLVNIYYLAEWYLWDLGGLWNEGLVPLFFAAQLFRRPEALQIWRFQLQAAELAACERELADIRAEYAQPAPSLLFVRGAFFKILVILARAWQRQSAHGGLHFRSEIWRAIQVMDMHIKEGKSFGIATFAREIGLATGSFSRLFTTATGFAPSEFFGRRRTQHAAHLLLESDLTIGEIAARLGFCDSAHLSRAFLKNQRLSPRAFRARYRQPGG